MIKSVWLNMDRNHGALCIRMDRHHPNVPQLVANKTVMPPASEVGKPGMTLDVALAAGKAEEHWVIGSFSYEDLQKIREAIDKILGDR